MKALQQYKEYKIIAQLSPHHKKETFIRKAFSEAHAKLILKFMDKVAYNNIIFHSVEEIKQK